MVGAPPGDTAGTRGTGVRATASSSRGRAYGREPLGRPRATWPEQRGPNNDYRDPPAFATLSRMVRVSRIAVPDCLHHVTTRGPTELAPFPDGASREQFLGCFGKVAGENGWTALAYSVLSTHYHVLVHVPDDSLSAGMHKLHTRYALWLNRRAGRRGRVWADRFGSRPLRSGQHVANAIVYVDLNAVEAGLTEEVGGWQWDSASANAGLSAPRPWHDPGRARTALGFAAETTAGAEYRDLLQARLSLERLSLGRQPPGRLSLESLSLGGRPSSRGPRA